MSEGRPRRSAASSNRAWATLMPKGAHDEDEFHEEVPETKAGTKRVASKEHVGTATPAKTRKKKGTSESEAQHSDSASEQTQPTKPEMVSPSREALSPKPSLRSPKKLPPPPKPMKGPVPTPNAAQVANDADLMQQEFDRHNASLIQPTEDDMDEEEEVPVVPAKPMLKARARPIARAPAPLSGMDDPNDADYVDEEVRRPPKKKALPQNRARPLPQMSPSVHRGNIVLRPPVRPPVMMRPSAPNRMVFGRFPSVVNGGPRVVQPRFVNTRPVNAAVLKAPVASQNLEIPPTILKTIEKGTEDIKSLGSPELESAFELIALLRDELDRAHRHIKESTTYYQTFIEDVQAAALQQLDANQRRINALESQNQNLTDSLKKASAIAHQKTLTRALDSYQMRSHQTVDVMGHEQASGQTLSPHKMMPQHQYMVVDSDAVDQQQVPPRDYLVQEEEYPAQQSQYYAAHDAMIQETSKELDNML